MERITRREKEQQDIFGSDHDLDQKMHNNDDSYVNNNDHSQIEGIHDILSDEDKIEYKDELSLASKFSRGR